MDTMRKLYIVYGKGTVGGVPGEWWNYFTFPLTATEEQITTWCKERKEGYTHHKYLHDVNVDE